MLGHFSPHYVRAAQMYYVGGDKLNCKKHKYPISVIHIFTHLHSNRGSDLGLL